MHDTSDNVTDFLVTGSIKSAMKGTKSVDLWQPNVELLKVLPNFNVRLKNEENAAHIRFLADSMKAHGFMKSGAIVVYVAKEGLEDVIYIVDGHCRYQAVLLANSELSEADQIKTVYAMTVPAGTSMEDITLGIFQYNSGKQLGQYEKALLFKRLSVQFGKSPAEIAANACVSVTHVDRLLLLMSSPLRVRQLVEMGYVAVDVAIDAIKAHGSDVVAVLNSALAEVTAKADESAAAKGVVADKTARLKITNKHLNPQSAHQKQLKKAAPELYETVAKVRAHEAFNNLPVELRQEIMDLMAKLAETKNTDADLQQELPLEAETGVEAA
ncbi:ParB N-terminal domain-containing protein [Iodobacter sp. CM08]|uniref:ParB/RepB/Spo0J family partition protein n=1 Tax=Iodobacter sp. CM08 TaxID=3085902 RepID=UPI002980FA0A|nr:ParB N-terminal domain-containing protein [Iodobacter sp. CM08]MDW5418134.1 ParB N-terminal domain-containing protein [Iodobacter sp. CM08]